MDAFTYHVPDTLEAAIALHRDAGAGARFLAGGTDLYLALDRGGPAGHGVSTVIDLKRIPGLAGIAAQPDGGWRLGALTPMAEIERHTDLPAQHAALCEGASYVGGPAIRNRATLGGNLCNASPAADTATPLLALGAVAEIAGPAGTRTCPLADFWLGPRRTVLGPGEVLVAVLLPAPPPRMATGFQRLTRTAMDIAVVNAAARVALDAAGYFAAVAVALGAVGPTPLAVPGLDALQGRLPDDEAFSELREAARAAAQPIDDVRGSAAYRKDTAGTLAERAARQAAGRAAALRGGEA